MTALNIPLSLSGQIVAPEFSINISSFIDNGRGMDSFFNVQMDYMISMSSVLDKSAISITCFLFKVLDRMDSRTIFWPSSFRYILVTV